MVLHLFATKHPINNMLFIKNLFKKNILNVLQNKISREALDHTVFSVSINSAGLRTI